MGMSAVPVRRGAVAELSGHVETVSSGMSASQPHPENTAAKNTWNQTSTNKGFIHTSAKKCFPPIQVEVCTQRISQGSKVTGIPRNSKTVTAQTSWTVYEAKGEQETVS